MQAALWSVEAPNLGHVGDLPIWLNILRPRLCSGLFIACIGERVHMPPTGCNTGQGPASWV